MGRGSNYCRAPFNVSYLMISFKKARLSAIQYEFTKDVFLLLNLIVTDQRTNGRTDRQTDQQTDKASYRVACPQPKRENVLNFTDSFRRSVNQAFVSLSVGKLSCNVA